MDIESFFLQQMACWPECKKHFEALKSAQSRSVMVDGREFKLFFNPARIRSAAAKVEGGKVDRPCFLCTNAIPKEQLSIHVKTLPLNHEYDIRVNPYPIVDRHFTIVCSEHTRQDLKGRLWDMAYFADLMPDYLIFFNGACSGASAPDHMHFQAVPKALVPLTSWSKESQITYGVTDTMPKITDSDYKNVILWTEGNESHWLVINRKCLRPRQYPEIMVSPASLEFCGLVPLALEKDYNLMDSALLTDIFHQCASFQPFIHVGIVDSEQVRFSADERVHALNYKAEDQILDVIDYDTNRAEKSDITEYWSTKQPFTLEGVTIGKNFHWEQKEDQVFNGYLHVIAREGQLHAINIIPVEEYLKSVISSEMSANNNLELLKTHAIISRSWVLRQLQNKRGSECPQNSSTEVPDTCVKWWDHDDHKLYDVCADDHCQRYQGISREVSPLVEQAVNETIGEVLLDENGDICDARFSKCCGGITELFSTCWQDKDYSYLQSVADPYCNTSDKSILKLVLNDYDQKTVDFYNWSVTYTQKEISELFERKTSLHIGDITDLVPVKRGPSGRIEYLKVVGTLRTVTIGKELMIRKAFSESHLYSSAFDVVVSENTADAGANTASTEATNTSSKVFKLIGKGWGHGVGLCQIGAAVMSVKGFSYRQILEHYFSGAKIDKLY